jgi:ribosomal protein L16/L10AE
MENLKTRQKRVVKLKRRNINIGGYRNMKDYICIIAKKNHRITEEQLKSIKMDTLTPKGLLEGKLIKIFKIKIMMKPNKVLTNKGILVRMGKGKGKVKTNVLYLTTGSVCIILKPKNNITLNTSVISKILNKFILKYSFFTYRFLI